MIDSRLKQVMDQLKETASIPVIVRLNTAVDGAAQQELSATGLRISNVGGVSPVVYGFATSATIPHIDNLPIVAKVSYDEPMYAAVALPFGIELKKKDIIPLSESINSMEVPHLWEQGLTGEGVNIGVIDTGVSQTHPMIQSGLKGTFSAVPNETVEDENHHGTWCCSAAAGRPVDTEHGYLVGAAPEANLFALKALGDKGNGQMSWVMRCMEKAATDFKCDVISMSLGSLFDNAGLDPVSDMVNDIVTGSNTICVIAAGNSFIPMSIGSPGGAIGSLTVGSHSLRMPGAAPSTFESKGPTTGLLIKPDTSAPGGNLAAPGFAELIMAAGAHNSYAPMAGTSMATPQVAGIMALLKQANKALSRSDVEQLLAMTAFPRIKDTLSGFGPINARKLYQNMGKALLPLAQLQEPLNKIQSAMFAPLAAVPRPENERLKAVRLPAFMG